MLPSQSRTFLLLLLKLGFHYYMIIMLKPYLIKLLIKIIVRFVFVTSFLLLILHLGVFLMGITEFNAMYQLQQLIVANILKKHNTVYGFLHKNITNLYTSFTISSILCCKENTLH